jgi:putative ABC transport system permease protein
MIKNYLKVAWRNVTRSKTHSLIKLSGLAAGLVCSLLILLWVNDERSVDAFHRHKNRLFAVYQSLYDGHNANAGFGTPGPLADELKKTIPEVEYASGWGFGVQHMFKSGDKLLKLDGNSAQADFFKMFGYPLLLG